MAVKYPLSSKTKELSDDEMQIIELERQAYSSAPNVPDFNFYIGKIDRDLYKIVRGHYSQKDQEWLINKIQNSSEYLAIANRLHDQYFELKTKLYNENARIKSQYVRERITEARTIQLLQAQFNDAISQLVYQHEMRQRDLQSMDAEIRFKHAEAWNIEEEALMKREERLFNELIRREFPNMPDDIKKWVIASRKGRTEGFRDYEMWNLFKEFAKEQEQAKARTANAQAKKEEALAELEEFNVEIAKKES